MLNESSYKFVDISSEKYRKYTFPSGNIIIITKPTHLAVSDNGHRVLDANNVSHYIPLGWEHLEWEVEEGEPNFVK